MAETPTIELKRHYVPLSEKETEELVGVMADFVVDYIKRRGGPGRNRVLNATETNREGEAHGPGKKD